MYYRKFKSGYETFSGQYWRLFMTYMIKQDHQQEEFYMGYFYIVILAPHQVG